MSNRNRSHKSPTCAATGKLRLRDGKDVRLTLRDAQMARANAALDGQSHSWQVVRGYKCTECHGWHLTSRRASTVAVLPVRGIAVAA
jgi:hypothetical protein